MSAKQERHLRMIEGRVVSDKMDKTRVILVETLMMHPLLKKTIRRSRRYKVHDEKNESHTGDLISAIETRPLSKHKRHRLTRILERAT
ncbi:MAG: 30S ribosomal protein S17 [Spirochaetales bacterium]|nr:30S ribosomal protein S17 [Spirochaetales bacterium]